MSQTLEERITKLEAVVEKLQSKLPDSKRPFPDDGLTNEQRLPPEYWARREARLSKIRILKPLDSTEAVSADRDAR